MGSGRLWPGGSRKLAVLFLAVTAPPAAALVWLGLQLVGQDRTLLAQREQESRQAAAQAAVLSLEQSLAAVEQGFPPPGAVRLTLTSRGIEAQPRDGVFWLPQPPPLVQAESKPFAEAEAFEYRGELARARSLYEGLAPSPKPGVRAGAHLRLARIERQGRNWDLALQAYRDLAGLPQVGFDGMPADLLARRAAGAVLEEAGRVSELQQHAASLESDLLAGRWPLDRTAWELSAAEIAHWTGHQAAPSAQREAFSQAAAWLWEQRQSNPGRRVVVDSPLPITLLRRVLDGQTTAIALAPATLEAWARKAGAGVSLLTDSGRLIAGPSPDPGPALLRRPPAESGLPWTLAVRVPGGGPSAQFATRRRLLSLGLAAIMALLAGGSYLLWRVVHRELAVARLQTDFVSAVSHEFRTPLASLRHVTELLEERDELPKDRRLSFYQVLGRNTERLHRLVESLLDFARMESGRKPYDLRPVDAAALVRQVTDDFRREAEPRGFRIDLDLPDQALPVRADAESLTHALWNLLDNAVKYSPEPNSIGVSAVRHPRGVALSVRDHGLGIPAAERKEIFRKFVRGASARKLGIKGTGLGLAMVAHIAEAHGASIEVDSKEGAGSTFRIVLPAEG